MESIRLIHGRALIAILTVSTRSQILLPHHTLSCCALSRPSICRWTPEHGIELGRIGGSNWGIGELGDVGNWGELAIGGNWGGNWVGQLGSDVNYCLITLDPNYPLITYPDLELLSLPHPLL